MILNVMDKRFTFLIFVATFLFGCATHRFQPIEMLNSPLCDNGKGVLWAGAKKSDDRMVAWCRSVGTVVLTTANAMQIDVAESGLTVLTWNKHEDFGDLEGVLRSYAGTPFIALVQEVARASPTVPQDFPATFRVPKRIGPHQTIHRDIVTIARDFNLSFVYLPSMPNGFGSGEDRGNAILSTLPISNVVGIELPLGSQRRVAIMATLTAIKDGLPWRLRVINLHLDNRAHRWSQASAVIDFLSRQNLLDLPIIVGGDLNTSFGVRDKATRIINNVVPRIRECGNEGTFRLFGLQLDHLFTTLPNNVQSDCSVSPNRFGSDHYPVVLHLFKKTSAIFK